MSETYQNEQKFNFSGGVNQSVSRLLMADSDCNIIENGELVKIGSIQKIKGYSQRGNDVNTGYKILGMVDGFKPSDGTKKQIVIADGASNSDAYTYNPINGAWTAHGLGLTSGAKAEFEPFLNGFFMVNFEDATRFNDLSTWSTSVNVTSAAKAKYIKQYLSRVYLAYVVTGGTTYPSRVTYSDLPSGTTPTITWNDTLNYFDVASDDGDVLMGLEVNANRLLCFKQKSLYRYDTNTLYQVPGAPGTVSQRSIRNIQGHTLYLHSTGIWDYNGTTSTLISRKIQEVIDGVSTKSLSDANAWVRGDHYYLYLGDILNSKTGFTCNNCLVDFDISKQAYTWRSLKDVPTVWMDYPDDSSNITYNDPTITYNDSNTAYNAAQSSEQRTFFGTDSGQVMRFDVGGDFDGVDIPFTIETKDYYLGYPAFQKMLERVVVFNDYAGKGIVVQYKIDDEDWDTLGRVGDTANILVFPSGKSCKRVRFRILESSSGQPFSFEGLDIYFTPTSIYT